jgi:hypothetical protein
LANFGMETLGVSRPFVIFYCYLVYDMAIWYILWSFGAFCGRLVHFVVVWCIFPILEYQGN